MFAVHRQCCGAGQNCMILGNSASLSVNNQIANFGHDSDSWHVNLDVWRGAAIGDAQKILSFSKRIL